MLAKSYTKECKHIVRHHNGEQKHQGAHGGRKLMSVETEFEDAQEPEHEVSAKELIDTLRGKFDEKFEDAEKEFAKAKNEAEKTFDEREPSWMKKGLFGFDRDEKPTKYSFEGPDSNIDTPAKETDKKYIRHKKHHKPCIVITILIVSLFASHLYQLRHLAKSLIELQEMGAKPKKIEKKDKKEKKTKQIVEQDQIVQEVPVAINYEFDDHTGNDELVYPIVSQPT